MSNPDDPTRHIPPTQGQPGHDAPRVREREYATGPVEDDREWRAHVLDRLDSLRTGLVAVGIVAVLAAGAAAYALLSDDDTTGDDDGRAGASREQVDDVADRVDELESKLGNRASDSAVTDLRDAQEGLDERVSALEEESGEGNSEEISSLQTAIEDLGQAVEQLDARLTDVEQRQDEQESQQQP